MPIDEPSSRLAAAPSWWPRERPVPYLRRRANRPPQSWTRAPSARSATAFTKTPSRSKRRRRRRRNGRRHGRATAGCLSYANVDLEFTRSSRRLGNRSNHPQTPRQRERRPLANARPRPPCRLRQARRAVQLVRPRPHARWPSRPESQRLRPSSLRLGLHASRPANPTVCRGRH